MNESIRMRGEPKEATPAAHGRAEYRDRLRALFGAGGFRVMANGEIRTRICAGMVWGRVGDMATERALFGDAGRARRRT